MTKVGSQAKDARRIVVATALLIASPFYILCGFRHVCLDGHIASSVWDLVIDWIWIVGFAIYIVFCWKANLRLRKTLLLLVMLLTLSRLVLVSGVGLLFPIEIPALLVAGGLAARNLFSGAPDYHAMSAEQLRLQRREILRGWVIAGATIAVTGVILWVAPRFYRFIKTKTAEVITLTDVPASREIRLLAGRACILRLPDGKMVALWCARAHGAGLVLDDAPNFEYGEVPFKRLESEEIHLAGGGVTSGEYLSYIRQGPLIYSGNGNTREYVLYVDNYTLSIIGKQKGISGDAVPLTIAIRQATGREMIPPKQEREHYLQALHSTDPKIRLEAVHELGEMVSLGSIYAGNRTEIADAIRPFLKDENADIRQEALARLRVMGDDEALLEMLTPRPIRGFSEPNGAWTIAGWCNKDSDRVPKHVMTFLETDDAKLQEFALAFFSCYKLSYFPAQPYVVKYLKSGVPAVRAASASAIRFTCERKTASSLLNEALSDPSDSVVLEALKDASYFNDSIPVQRLVALLASGNAEVREKAAYALDCCHNEAAVPPLLLATRDETPLVRAQAAVTLGRIGDAKAYGRLVELLQDSDASVRESAVNGLRWMGRRDAIEAIAALAENDPNGDVRQMARRTVRELKSK